MKNEIALKVYDVDYSFIIKNYLAPDLWEKTWTLFVYKNVRVNLQLYQIDVKKPIKIRFKITIQDENFNDYNFVTHDTENSNINVLKRQINGEISRLIEVMEKHYIRQEDGYKSLQNTYYDEEDRLRDIAKSYLDENGITLEDVRDAYIDKYVSDNSKGYTFMSNYVDGRKYKNKPDLWLIFYKAIKDDKKCEEIYKKVSSDIEFNNKMIEIKEYIDMLSDDESDEYQEWYSDMTDCLEAI